MTAERSTTAGLRTADLGHRIASRAPGSARRGLRSLQWAARLTTAGQPTTEENHDVDVRIGVTNTPKEIDIELPDGTDADALSKQIEETLGSETAVLWLTDRRGRRVGVPAAKVAYIELESKSDDRRVGFGSGIK
jgi:Protein of unknown function (DUF3107)